MPVPVPLYSKQPAHPVIKINQSVDSDYQPSVFHPLTQSLPLPPCGPPPSFATREEWISSLPSWRRNKPRRIWEEDPVEDYNYVRQGFEEGLTAADNAAVIKGAPAQACIPPISTLFARAGFASPPRPANMYTDYGGDVDEEMSAYSSRVHGWQGRHDDVSPVTNAGYEDVDMDNVVDPTARYESFGTDTSGSYRDSGLGHFYPAEAYERGAFSPVFEDMSPEAVHMHEPASSPIGPATPFGEFVDRAVAAAQLVPPYDYVRAMSMPLEVRQFYQEDRWGSQCHQCQSYGVMDQAAPEPVVTPTATVTYKKLAEPLSEWIASYVWKVCTTGMSLPSTYAQPMAFIKPYPSAPPGHLAASTHSMLLSTLLQPSAVFLALWYIVRLPVFFGPVNLDRDLHKKEIRFRAELLGEARMSYDRDAIELYAPFRLILLGCMLANKWLDDHTFSNKTWHTISNVPIQSINKLESLALDIFCYDLSISPCEWTDWLSHLLLYHSSLNSGACPQPISRPSTSPHTIIRKSVETLVHTGVVRPTCSRHGNTTCTSCPPEPVFVGPEERRNDRYECSRPHDQSVDALEIDLDEDGPLREEYLPRRRISGVGSTHRSQIAAKFANSDRTLPPPAKWSPAADSPIFAPRNVREPRQYVAPQPVSHMPVVLPPPPPQGLPFYHTAWSYGGYMPEHEKVAIPEHPAPHPAPAVYHTMPSYAGYDYAYPTVSSHSRSHSLSYNQVVAGQPYGRPRSYSQTGYDQGYSDIRFTDGHFAPPPPAPMMTCWSPIHPVNNASFYERPFEYHQRPLKV